MKLKYLQTKHVLLRQYHYSDFNQLLDLNSDPEVMKYLTNGVPSTHEDVLNGVERTLFYQNKFNGNLGVFSAELLESGEFMGWFLLRPDKKNLENLKELELGYRLKQQFWGKGYATEVSLALLQKAFVDLQAECVFAQTLSLNLASRRVMEKIGMTFEKEFIDDDYPEEGLAILYRIVKSDWDKNHNTHL